MSLRKQLQAVYDEHGKLTPALVVTVARDPDHPLHDRFEWDDAIAGEAWRREQAHQLIRSVKVVYKPADETSPERSVRAFHAIRQSGEDNDGFVYMPAEEVAADPLLTKMLLTDMEREWQTLRRRYQDFEEFWSMVRREASDTAA